MQSIYHLLDRGFESLLACWGNAMAWIPISRSVEAGADLPRVPVDPVVPAVAVTFGATPTQVGLAWQLAHTPNTMLIPGTGTIERGLIFHPGAQLRLVVSSRSLLGTMMPGNREYTPDTGGQHIVHTGGDRASYLQLPVKTGSDHALGVHY